MQGIIGYRVRVKVDLMRVTAGPQGAEVIVGGVSAEEVVTRESYAAAWEEVVGNLAPVLAAYTGREKPGGSGLVLVKPELL